MQFYMSSLPYPISPFVKRPPEGFRPDPVTSGTDNQDDVNDRDVDKYAPDNRRSIDRLNALTKSLTEASTK